MAEIIDLNAYKLNRLNRQILEGWEEIRRMQLDNLETLERYNRAYPTALWGIAHKNLKHYFESVEAKWVRFYDYDIEFLTKQVTVHYDDGENRIDPPIVKLSTGQEFFLYAGSEYKRVRDFAVFKDGISESFKTRAGMPDTPAFALYVELWRDIESLLVMGSLRQSMEYLITEDQAPKGVFYVIGPDEHYYTVFIYDKYQFCIEFNFNAYDKTIALLKTHSVD